MRIWRSIPDVPADLGRTVVTVGNFDGVHRGHRHVVARCRATADRLGVEKVVAVTFDPHPLAVLRPEHAPVTLTDLDERAGLLAEAGVDDLLVLPFSTEMASWSPEHFLAEVLERTLHAAAVVVGANFRFGHRAAGDLALLRTWAEDRGIAVDGLDLDGGPQVWSSTYVRTCLAAGDVEGAAEALGRPVVVRGSVVRGDARGREIGYPTANVPATSGLVPADGVYAGWVHVPGSPERLPAAISVGTNPTFAGVRTRRVESYVLDRTDLDLYDLTVAVEFVTRLRAMVGFGSLEELLVAMAGDVARTRTVLGLA